MSASNYFRCIVIYLLVFLSSFLFAQSPDATSSLQYPFKKSDMPGEESSTLDYWESQKRCGDGYCGWNFLIEADYDYYIDEVYQYTYEIYHPAWDMNVVNTSGNGDKGTKLRAIADGEVISPSDFNPGKNYKIPSLWNELLIKHNVGGKIWITAYGHSDTIFVKEGDIVETGDIVATLGEKGAPGVAHLHLEVRDSLNFSSGDVETPNFWDVSPTGSNILHDFADVSNWYYNPELFIKGATAIGRTSTGEHSEGALKWVLEYLGHQTDKLGEDYWDKWQYIDQVVDRGDGDIYVHYVPDGSDPDKVEVQDFYNVVEDKYAALIYNPDLDEIIYTEDPILGRWFEIDGYEEAGPPIEEQDSSWSKPNLRANYANSMDISGSDLASPGDLILVQKFKKNNSNDRTTIVYNPGTSETDTFAVGKFRINKSPGEQWYIIVDEYPVNDIPWPRPGVVSPTGIWYTKPGDYDFVRHDKDGNRVTGATGSFSVPITQGNSQFTDGPDEVVENPVKMTNLSLSENSGAIDISWTDPNSTAATPYIVFRSDGFESPLLYDDEYTDNSVVAGQTYSYTVSGNGTPESAPETITVSGWPVPISLDTLSTL